jgi:hypothetical protein
MQSGRRLQEGAPVIENAVIAAGLGQPPGNFTADEIVAWAIARMGTTVGIDAGAARTGEVGVTDPRYPVGDVRRYGGSTTAAGLVNAAALQRAHDALPSTGGIIMIPDGDFVVSGTGAQLLLVTKPVTIRGAGWRSRLVVASTVGASTDVIRVAPTSGGLEGCRFERFAIVPQSGTPGRYGINVDVSSGYVAYAVFDHLRIGTLGSYAIQCTNTVPNADGWFTTTIRDSVITGGINFSKAGDSLRIVGNTITGARGILVDLVSGVDGGAHLFLLADNNITCDAGTRILNATTGRILRNNIEQPNASTGPNSAMLDLDGSATTVLENIVVEGNYLGATTGNCLSTVRVNYAKGVVIRDNFTVSPGALPTYAGYRVTTNAVATQIQHEHLAPYGVTMGSMLEDNGTGTAVDWKSPGALSYARFIGHKAQKVSRTVHQAGSAQSTTPIMDVLDASDATVLSITSAGLALGASGTVVTQTRVYSQTLTPTAVGANGVSEQTFTVTGLTTADKVFINPPAPANQAIPIACRVSAADTIAITFLNPTAGSLTPGSGAYKIVAIRS